jgi:hypothetical protein
VVRASCLQNIKGRQDAYPTQLNNLFFGIPLELHLKLILIFKTSKTDYGVFIKIRQKALFQASARIASVIFRSGSY